MPGVAVDVGTGTSVTFATTGFTAELLSLRLVGLARRALQTSHMGTSAPSANRLGNRTHTRGRLVNAGQLIMGLHFNPNTNPPMHAPPEAITITWPRAPGVIFDTHWETTGFATQLDITDSLDEIMIGQLTVQLNSEIDNDEGQGTILWTEGWEYVWQNFPTVLWTEGWES